MSWIFSQSLLKDFENSRSLQGLAADAHHHISTQKQQPRVNDTGMPLAKVAGNWQDLRVRFGGLAFMEFVLH